MYEKTKEIKTGIIYEVTDGNLYYIENREREEHTRFEEHLNNDEKIMKMNNPVIKVIENVIGNIHFIKKIESLWIKKYVEMYGDKLLNTNERTLEKEKQVVIGNNTNETFSKIALKINENRFIFEHRENGVKKSLKRKVIGKGKLIIIQNLKKSLNK